MKKIALTILCLIMGGCSPIKIDGYYRNPFSRSDIIWEHSVDMNSEEEQVFEVPYIRYGTNFSICWDKSFNFKGCNNYYDKNDRIDYMTFSIGDSTFSTSNDLLICHVSAFACPIDGGAGVYFDVPEGFDLETGGTLRIKFKQIKYLKDVPNPRVVLAYSSHFK